jgi:hypothetical protein
MYLSRSSGQVLFRRMNANNDINLNLIKTDVHATTVIQGGSLSALCLMPCIANHKLLLEAIGNKSCTA